MDFKNLFFSALFLPTIFALHHEDNWQIGLHHQRPKVISISETLPIEDNLEYYVDDANDLENNRITPPNKKIQPSRINGFTKVSGSNSRKWGVNFQRRPDIVNQENIVKVNYTSNLRGSVRKQKPFGNRRISETQFGSDKGYPFYETHHYSEKNIPSEDNFQTNLPNLKQSGSHKIFNHKKINKIGLASDKLNAEDNTRRSTNAVSSSSTVQSDSQGENEYGDELKISESTISPSTVTEEITETETENSEIEDFSDENSEDYPTSSSKTSTVSNIDLKQKQRQIDLSLNKASLTATSSEHENDYDIDKPELTSSEPDSTLNPLMSEDLSTDASLNTEEPLSLEDDVEQTTTFDYLLSTSEALTPQDEFEYDEVTTILSPASSTIPTSTTPINKNIKVKPDIKKNVSKFQFPDSSLTEIEGEKPINQNINEEDKNVEHKKTLLLSTKGPQLEQIVTKETVITTTSSSINKNKHKLVNNGEHSYEIKKSFENNPLNSYLPSSNKHSESMESPTTNQDEEDSYYYEDEFSVASSKLTTVKPILKTTLKNKPAIKVTTDKSTFLPKITTKSTNNIQNSEQSQTSNNDEYEYYNDEDFESTSAKPILTTITNKTPIPKIPQHTTLFKKERTNGDLTTAENLEETIKINLSDVTTTSSLNTNVNLTINTTPPLDNNFDNEDDENNDLLSSTESLNTEEPVSTLKPTVKNKVTTKKIENTKIAKVTTVKPITKITSIKPQNELSTVMSLITTQKLDKASTTKKTMTTKVESDNKNTKITKQSISIPTTVKPETTTEEYDYYNDDDGSLSEIRGYHKKHVNNDKKHVHQDKKIQIFPQAKDNFDNSLEYDNITTEKPLVFRIHTTKNIYGRTKSNHKHLQKKTTESPAEITTQYEITTLSNLNSESPIDLNGINNTGNGSDFSNNSIFINSVVNKISRSNINETDSNDAISSNDTTTIPSLSLTTEITTPDYIEADYNSFHLSNPFVKESVSIDSENIIDDVTSSSEQTNLSKEGENKSQMPKNETSTQLPFDESDIMEELDLPAQKLPITNVNTGNLTKTSIPPNITSHKDELSTVHSNSLTTNKAIHISSTSKRPQNKKKINQTNNLSTNSKATTRASYQEFDYLELSTDADLIVPSNDADNAVDSLELENIRTQKPIMTKSTLKPKKSKGGAKQKLSTSTISQSTENFDDVDAMELTTVKSLLSQTSTLSSATLKPDLSTKLPLHTTSKSPFAQHSVSQKVSTNTGLSQSTTSPLDEDYDYLDLTSVKPILSESRTLPNITIDIQSENIIETTESTLSTANILMISKPSKTKNSLNPKTNTQSKLSTSTESSFEDYDYLLSTLKPISSESIISPSSASNTKLENIHETINSGLSTKKTSINPTKSSNTKEPLNKKVNSQSSLSPTIDDENLDYLEMSSVKSTSLESSTSLNNIPDSNLDEIKGTTKSALSTKTPKKVTKKLISKTKEPGSKKIKSETIVSPSTTFTHDELDDFELTTLTSILTSTTNKPSNKIKPLFDSKSKNRYDKPISSDNGKLGNKTGPVWSQHNKKNLSFSKETVYSEDSKVSSLKKEGREKHKYVKEDEPLCSSQKGTINNETTVLTCKNESAQFVSWKGYNSLLVTVCSANPEPDKVVFADIRPETEEHVDNSHCELIKSSGSCVQQYMPLTAMIETEIGKFKECIKIPIKCSCQSPEENI